MERYGNESYKTENCKTENDKSENSNLENYQIENCKAENNLVLVRGEIATEITFSHRNYGENFYRLEMAVKRRSDYMDRIPVIFSEQMIDVTQGHVGQEIEIQGQFRSRNQWEENHSRLLLSVFARSLRLADADRGEDSFNEIFLNGFLCKPPLYRITSSGREITELLLAVNRRYGGKADYIPAICWGYNARHAADFAVGEHVQVWGRIQSREYIKQLAGSARETRTAYEISVVKLCAQAQG